MGTKREKGFTLVELMVVIVLIGLLAGVVGVKVIPLIFTGQTTTAEAQIKEIKGNLDLFYMAYSRYPETLEELTQPTETRDSFMDEIPLDPWDEEYVYVLQASSRGTPSYQIYSKGPDRIDGTDDDITGKTRREP